MTADSGDEVAEVVDVTGDSEGDVAEEAPSGSPPLRFHGYRRCRELGRGASGQVFLCKRRGCTAGFAVKAVDLRRVRLSPHVDREQKKLRREVDILKSLPPHPSIAQLVDAFDEGDWFLLVLELVGGGDLYTVLTAREPARLLEREAAFVLQQLGGGLEFLHGRGIIHRDLKLENVLVASEQRQSSLVLYGVKITDFGLSKAVGVGLSEALSTVGTHPYIAPEVMSTESYDFSSDLWCLGVLLFVLLAGHFPFESAMAEQAELDSIIERLKASKTARAVVQGLLQLEPSQRLSLEEMRSHEWLQEELERDDHERPPKRQRGAAQEVPALEDPASVAVSSPLISTISARNTESLFGSADAPTPLPMPPVDPAAKAALDEQAEQTAEAKADPDAKAEAEPKAEAEAGHGAGIVPGPAAAGVAGFGATLRLSEVCPASSEPDVMQVHVVVPNRLAGAILGKSGTQMKHIAASAGCKVWMTSREGNEDRRVVIIGKYSQCAIAQELLQRRLWDALHAEGQEPCAGLEAVLLVRAEAAGVVIGKQGFCLQQIREQSGARIQLLREEVEGQRPCIIKGELQSLLQAQRHIFDLVRAVPLAPRLGVNPAPLAAQPPDAGTGAGAGPMVRLLVPADLAGMVIGKQGSGLRQIREQCGVKVQMLQEAQAPQWPKDRVLILRGPLAGRQAAVDAVLRVIAKASPDATCNLRILVPASQAGGVIGKQGCMLKSVRERCNVNLFLDREEVCGERLVIATAPHNQLLGAAATILQLLEGTRCVPTGQVGPVQSLAPAI